MSDPIIIEHEGKIYENKNGLILGKTVGDLTTAEIRSLDLGSVQTVACALSAVLRMKELELAQTNEKRWMAEYNYAGVQLDRSHEAVKLAQKRNREGP